MGSRLNATGLLLVKASTKAAGPRPTRALRVFLKFSTAISQEVSKGRRAMLFSAELLIRVRTMPRAMMAEARE